jgi:hypothetical protein
MQMGSRFWPPSPGRYRAPPTLLSADEAQRLLDLLQAPLS